MQLQCSGTVERGLKLAGVFTFVVAALLVYRYLPLMVGERAKAGRGTLTAWLWRCRVSVGR